VEQWAKGQRVKLEKQEQMGMGMGRVVRRHRGEGEWVTWEQEKESRRFIDVIQTVQCSTIRSSCGSLVKSVFQRICLVTAHARVVSKQRPLGLERNGDQVAETVETEEELYKKTESEDEVRIGMDPTGEKSDVSQPIQRAVVFNVLCQRSQCVV
jgi:hypothetical protein